MVSRTTNVQLTRLNWTYGL